MRPFPLYRPAPVAEVTPDLVLTWHGRIASRGSPVDQDLVMLIPPPPGIFCNSQCPCGVARSLNAAAGYKSFTVRAFDKSVGLLTQG